MVNLIRRSDRRAWIERTLPADLCVTFTSDWTGPFDGSSLTREGLDVAGYKLFPWQIECDNPWWSRPLKYGEVGCTLAHLACWRDAAGHGEEPYVVVLEDDAILSTDFLARLLDGLDRLEQAKIEFDLLYLGRFPLEPDREAVAGFVVPGYSHCTFGYLVTRKALSALLAAELEHAIVPVDEFLPALYIDHPRGDLRARFPKQLNALAFDPPLVRQRSKDEAGSDTEDSDFVAS
ncbi:glycosyltransferase family 25 protein [Lentzea sp. HUAS12]|uniref:glycosyltransferase family 25 protein n=1 Tax=Lentzea sp. HUAS12 TaxID=2951806 RepID=UPI00209DF434|nr:glycosyltransferase family 25 protein [Lentzea sp. HUAS12]USX56444.1 glycosyltransferase family 25 protein [Lentzea sp. HUAS12]